MPALGLKHLSMQAVAERSRSEMDIDGYRGFIRNRNPYKLQLSAISQHFCWTLPSLLQASQQFCFVLCALCLCITVFSSLLNMPYMLGNPVDLAWCPKAFADGQKCFILIKKGLQMQEYQFSKKREENTWWNGNKPLFLKDKRYA